jgi:hypothetical protein
MKPTNLTPTTRPMVRLSSTISLDARSVAIWRRQDRGRDPQSRRAPSLPPPKLTAFA